MKNSRNLKMKNDMERNSVNTRREALKGLSNRLCEAAKKAGNVKVSCNYLLKVYYKKIESSSMLKTFEQWKDDGFTIREGAVGKPFWGAPIQKQREGQMITFCPIKYWFSDKDVVEQDRIPCIS